MAAAVAIGPPAAGDPLQMVPANGPPRYFGQIPVGNQAVAAAIGHNTFDGHRQATLRVMQAEGFVRLYDDMWQHQYNTNMHTITKVLQDLNRTVQEIGTKPITNALIDRLYPRTLLTSAERNALIQADQVEFNRLAALQGPARQREGDAPAAAAAAAAGSSASNAERAPRYLRGNFRRFFNIVGTKLAGVPLDASATTSTFRAPQPDGSPSASVSSSSSAAAAGQPARKRRRKRPSAATIAAASASSSSSSASAAAGAPFSGPPAGVEPPPAQRRRTQEPTAVPVLPPQQLGEPPLLWSENEDLFTDEEWARISAELADPSFRLSPPPLPPASSAGPEYEEEDIELESGQVEPAAFVSAEELAERQRQAAAAVDRPTF